MIASLKNIIVFRNQVDNQSGGDNFVPKLVGGAPVSNRQSGAKQLWLCLARVISPVGR
jgi:hypothetical protein